MVLSKIDIIAYHPTVIPKWHREKQEHTYSYNISSPPLKNSIADTTPSLASCGNNHDAFRIV